MQNIPKEILDRIELETEDQLIRVKQIHPLEDCECGRDLKEVRVLKISRMEFPFPHIREYCNICKCHRHAGGEWYPAVRDLNQAMRAASYPKKPRL